MHVTHLDVHASPLAAFSSPPFRSEEWRNLGLASCARPAANLGNGIIQRTPPVGNANRGAQTKPPDCDVEDRTDAVKSAMVSRTADPFCIQGGMR
jgi:hypothetical protein